MTQESAMRSIAGGSFYSTPFVLELEKSNKYKIDDRLKDTVPLKNAIPFLRTNDQEYKEVVYRRSHRGSSLFGSPVKQGGATLNFVKHVQSPTAAQTMNVPDIKRRLHNFVRKREAGWQKYVLPISKLNEELHPSQKITFERI